MELKKEKDGMERMERVKERGLEGQKWRRKASC
jgi:hypothetical protein